MAWWAPGSSKDPKSQSALSQSANSDGKNNVEQEDNESAKIEAEIKEALAQLSPEERKLAEAQRFCAVQTEEGLGYVADRGGAEAQGPVVDKAPEARRTRANAFGRFPEYLPPG
jgi:hypothetical protein